MMWGNMTSDELAKLDKETVVVLPIGLVESHGPHMELNFDNESAEFFAKAVSEKSQALVLPNINYGFADANAEYPGTVNVKGTTLIAFVKDILESICSHGFKKIVILSGHGANKMPCTLAIYEAFNAYKDLKAAYWNYWEISGLTDIHHADKGETEIGMAINSDIRKEMIQDFSVTKPWYIERSRYETNPLSGGINGKPSEANLADGEEKREQVITCLIKKINSL